ncbi:MAG: ribosome silencing factor [Nitrospirota bacterium]
MSIKEKGEKSLKTKEKALISANAALEKKAFNIVIFEVKRLTSIADYFMICSGETERQVRSIVEGIDSILAKRDISPFSIEGMQNSQWVLMDYNDVIIHVFKEEIREFYDLERLWQDTPKILISEGEMNEFYYYNKKNS